MTGPCWGLGVLVFFGFGFVGLCCFVILLCGAWVYVRRGLREFGFPSWFSLLRVLKVDCGVFDVFLFGTCLLHGFRIRFRFCFRFTRVCFGFDLMFLFVVCLF